MNRRIGKLTSLVKTLTEKNTSNSREGSNVNVLSTVIYISEEALYISQLCSRLSVVKSLSSKLSELLFHPTTKSFPR